MYCHEAFEVRSSNLLPERAGMAAAVVAHVYGVTLLDMRSTTRGAPRTALARQVAMYLAHVVFSMGVSEIAAAFARNKTTAHHALRHVEDLRDDPSFDRTLRFLEGLLRDAAGRAT
ncbi:MAG: chromosomal replication initiator DnaA [Alphaproteobacteria bacterium]|nr:chromosomal replication initiator DnaA [Alphaproteobacteria bacterium]